MAQEQVARLSPLFTWRGAIVESSLTSTQRLVALALSLHMNERGGSCFPTQDTLASETALSRRAVIQALRDLEDAGWLGRVPGGGRKPGGNGRATEYTATIPTVQQVHPIPERTVHLTTKNSAAGAHQDVIEGDIEPSAAKAAAQPSGGDLVKFFVDESRARGSDPPRRVIGQVAKLTGELLTEGIPPDRVRAGLVLMLDKRLHPSTLPSMVHEAALPNRRKNGGGVTADEVMRQAVDLARAGR